MDKTPLNQREAKTLIPPQPLHQSDADEDDENVKQLDECSSLYLLMQDCVVRSNRNWKECQQEVQALRDCIEKRKQEVHNSRKLNLQGWNCVLAMKSCTVLPC